MKHYDFDGYSIQDLLKFTEGFHLFRFLGAGRGFNGNPQELGFIAMFPNEEKARKALDKIKTIWASLATAEERFFLITTINPVDPLRVDVAILKKTGGFKEEDFVFVRNEESKFMEALVPNVSEIRDPSEFPDRGFDRTRHVV